MILFHIKTANFKISNRRAIKSWLKDLINSYDKVPGEISIIFCESDYLLQMNRKYLGHDHYTDIITFPYTDINNPKINGDIFIDVETVRANAVMYSQPFEKEILRVMAHGVLHLLGENDTNEKEIEKMREAEEKALSQIKINPLK